jgi:hypothetical protein
VGLANLGSELETCVGSRVHLVGVSISFEKNFYRLPFTPPSLVRRIGPSPFSLEHEARRWYTLASVEAKGNWDELVKKFLLKFFPISNVQDLRRQVLTFKQGQYEGIDEAWDRFNELLERGPNLGFSGDLKLHTFYF